MQKAGMYWAFTQTHDDSAQHESVSPENLFSQHRGDFDVLPTEEQLRHSQLPQLALPSDHRAILTHLGGAYIDAIG